MRIFMHWDMEGTSGLLTRKHAWFWDADVPKEAEDEGRALLVADVNTAVGAALEAGADEVIVCDTHRGGGNIIMDQMVHDPRVRYLERSRGYQAGEFRWMPGLDETVDGFLVPGHHAMAGTPGAFLPHTWNLDWADFQINGQSVGEMGIEACFAGHWGIPVILTTGDETACREAAGMFPGIVTAAVKRPLDWETCEGLDLDSAHHLVAEKVREAIGKLRAGQCQAFQPALPMTVTLRFTGSEGAEKAAQRPGVERVDECTVQGRVEQRCDVVKWVIGTGLNMPPP
jgi:D-amino peptidase